MEPRRDDDGQYAAYANAPAAAVVTTASPAALSSPVGVDMPSAPQPRVPVPSGLPLSDADWVEAVERTIDQYSANPYALSEAMAKLRSNYLQQRYGRDFKSSE